MPPLHCKSYGAGIGLMLSLITAHIVIPYSAAAEDWIDELAVMSLEELTSIEVTSVSKKSESLSNADAAIYVITNDDIRRSGAATLPEILRLVPGLDVARINGNFWAISSRGFNGQFANKLLVLIDGRAIYTPFFSGVFWEAHDMVLEDIERIEVIRGPGGSLWGANAVNGIINVITRNARDTVGGLVSGEIATNQYGLRSLRYGTRVNDDLYYRVYGKVQGKNTSYADDNTHDDGHLGRLGLRLDWEPSSADTMVLDAGYYQSTIGDQIIDTVGSFPGFTQITDDRRYNGAYARASWSHKLDVDSEWSIQTFYDYQDYDVVFLDDRRRTFDIEFQHRFPLNERNELIWGLGYRFTSDKITSSDSANFNFSPESRDLNYYSAFIQNDMVFYPDRLKLTLGSKFEYNAFTHGEFQPTLRLTYTPNESNTFWGAVSRAVRTPSRSDNDAIIDFFFFNTSSFMFDTFTIVGSDDVESEELIAYEIGYRVQPTPATSLDIATFYNDYDNLISTRLAANNTGIFDNTSHGETYGVEVVGKWKPRPQWLLEASYSFLQIQLHRSAETAEGDSAHNKAVIRSLVDLPGNFQVDTSLRYVDTLPNQNNPSYIALDLRLGWQPNESLTLECGVQDALDNHHPEFGSGQFLSQVTEVRTNYYVRVTHQF